MIYSLDNSGVLRFVAGPSRDGNGLADAVASGLSHWRVEVPPFHVSKGFASTDDALKLGRDFTREPAVNALHWIGYLAAAERQQPGRKLLLWVAPETEGNSEPSLGDKDAQIHLFRIVNWFSTLLREARISLYALSPPGAKSVANTYWTSRLDGPRTAKQTGALDLYRKILAIKSGGLAPQEGDLAKQLETCMRDADGYYTLTFNPLPATHADDYHTLKVELRNPRLKARTTMDYYDQPWYESSSDPVVRAVSAAELERIVATLHHRGDRDAQRELASLRLSQRLNGVTLKNLLNVLGGNQARKELSALGAASQFLPPSPEEIPDSPAPGKQKQAEILGLADAYLKDTIQKLPDIFATRAAVEYEETPPFDKGTIRASEAPVLLTENSTSAVEYRRGEEVVNTESRKTSGQSALLETHGIFGPILKVVQDALVLPQAVEWERWEQSEQGALAIFRYKVTATENTSMYRATGCCLPIGEANTAYSIRPGYHGEIAIDPRNGDILRVELEADITDFVPMNRANIVVEYAPRIIGGKSYVVPVRSVQIWRRRSVVALQEWGASFAAWGPFETDISDFTFGHYHMFRSTARILP